MAKSAKASSAGKKSRTKSEVFRDLAEGAGLTRKQVAAVFEGLFGMIKKDLSAKGPGVFVVPGLMKIRVKSVAATKARKGKNPFTGEEMMFKAKPARRKVRVLPLKGLKELV